MNNRVLILAPRGRDAAIAADLLTRNGINACICATQQELVARLQEGAGAVLLTEEAIASRSEPDLAAWVANQAAWSDVPFVVLANGSRTPRTAAAAERLAQLGNVVLLERPLHAEAMLRTIRSSLNARARQYEARNAAALSAAQNRILELAMEEAPLAATLEAIIREVEGLSSSGVLGSILILDESGRQLRHGAAPNLPDAYNKAIDGISAGPDVGSCGTAVHRGEPVFVADIASDPLWENYRDLALAHGLRSCWSIPIKSDKGEVLGTFAMYHREVREPVATDLRIVDFVVRTVGIVLARARSERNLRESEARYRQIVEGAEDFAIVSLDAAGVITGWSSGAERLLGYGATEALGQDAGLFFTAEDKAARLPEREMERAASDGRAVNERWHVRKDGSLFWGSGLTMPLAGGVGGFVKIFRDRTVEHEAEAALRESEARLRFFSEMEGRLFGAAGAAEAMQAAARMLGEKLAVSRCAYADVDTDNDRFWIRSDYTAPGIASSAGTYSLDLFGPRAAADMRSGRTLVVSNVGTELAPGEGREMFQAIGIDAVVCCPLIKDGRLVAMMAVHQDRARDWTAADIALLKEVAERCWAHVERVGSEARLKESEERLRLAVDNAEIGLWDVDVVNNELIWPARTKAMFGISADVPVTMDDFYNGLHPDDRARTSAAYAASADPAVRALYDVEYRTIGKEDGIERWVAAKGRGVFDPSGHCVRVAGTALEITDRKAAEARLSAVADLVQALKDLHDPADIAFAASDVLGRALGAARVGYGGIDHDAETLHVDRDWTAPGVESLSGVLPLRAYGSVIDSLKRGVFTAIGDVRLDPRTSAAAAALEEKGARSFVNAPVLEHGRLVAVFFINHASPRNWSEGELALIREFADRTRSAVERARGEQALRESERRLRDLNETLEAQVEARSAERDRLWNLSQDMLARADYRGMMSAVSPAWTRVLGWSEQDLLTRGYATFMHPDDAPPTLAAIARMAETRQPTRFENRISTSDGGWKPIEWTVAPEPDGVNFIAVGRDLSHAKAREAELEKAQEALRQSQKMEAMGQLTGGVAHDFNNLLTPIVGALDMLQRKSLGGEREQRLIAGAVQSAERARTLVQRLLAFARRQPLQSIAVDIAKLVDGMGELVRSTTGPQIRVVVETADDLPPAKADPNQLEMALLNLSVNARDAMPDGGTLRISATAETIARGHASGLAPGSYVRISVADTGTGMDKATMARAVEPFFSTKGIGKGTGLGLSMVHGLASQLGGALTIQSRLGVGTNIELWLPMSGAAEEPVPSARRATSEVTHRGVALLVDDEALVRMSTADMLNDLGYAVVEASSAEEAARLLDEGQSVDILVTDHLMPGMTGAELARRVEVTRPHLPVLLVSGYAELEGVDADLPRLTKPFRKDELAATLETLLT